MMTINGEFIRKVFLNWGRIHGMVSPLKACVPRSQLNKKLAVQSKIQELLTHEAFLKKYRLEGYYMLYLFKTLLVTSLSLFFITPVYAGVFTGDPKRTVIMMETDKSRVNYHAGVRLNFCPVDKENKFKGKCGYKAYSFPGHSKEVYDTVDKGVYEYSIQWMKPQPKGLYAFANGTVTELGGWSNTLYGPGTVTQVAQLAGGTVAVITSPFTNRKSGYVAALNRAKAVFKKQYGSEVMSKMKFVAFSSAPVECKFKNSYFEYQINHNRCVLK